MTTKEKALADRLRALGYMLVWHPLLDEWQINDSFYNRYFEGPFKSIFSAASHMVPITRDNQLREMVSGL